MKKILALLATLTVVWVENAGAWELGNPAQLSEKGRFDVGIQWTDAFQQDFENYDLKRAYSDGYRNSDRKGCEFQDDKYTMATITYGLLDRVNIFAALGVADGGQWVDRQAGNNWQADLGSTFVWAVGAKAGLYQFDNGLGFGLAARYLRYDNRKVTNWKSTDTGETATGLGWVTDDHFDYWQLDVTPSAYWKLGAFTPYVGVGYTVSDVNFHGRWTHRLQEYGWVEYDASFRNENRLTALAGLDLTLGENFKANLQGTFVSSTALTLGISYAF